MLVLFLSLAAAPARADLPGGLVTGRDYLAYDNAQRRAYVAGMADQVTFLADAALEKGFGWFPPCLKRVGLDGLERAFRTYLEARAASLEEPAARSFVWAAAERCYGDGLP